MQTPVPKESRRGRAKRHGRLHSGLTALLRICVPVAALGSVAPIHGAALPTLTDSPAPFSFVVLGDMHYARPDYKARTAAAAVAEAIRDVKPAVAFVCHTGDLVDGGRSADGKPISREEMKGELTFAMQDIAGRFQRPFFIAVGNHDKHTGAAAFDEVVLPRVSRSLGAPLATRHYAFRHGNSAFVFLDYGAYSEPSPFDYAGQSRFLEEAIRQARATAGVEHVFLFAHYPLWPVVRPGFSSRRFTESVLAVMKRAPVDAFFCGHTHNSGAWVRQVGGSLITQIQGCTMDKSTELIPMEERRTLLIPRPELTYRWGYLTDLSGPTNAFFLVTVDGGRVRVQFRSGRDVIREFEWREPGRITDLVAPPARPVVQVTPAELARAKAAAIVFCPWAEEGATVGLSFNGERLAPVRIDPVPRWAAFHYETRIPIPAEKLGRLRLDNEIALENPDRGYFGIGQIQLEVELADGRIARTAIADSFLFSATADEAQAARKNLFGWEGLLIPTEISRAVPLGQPLAPARLSFSHQRSRDAGEGGALDRAGRGRRPQ